MKKLLLGGMVAALCLGGSAGCTDTDPTPSPTATPAPTDPASLAPEIRIDPAQLDFGSAAVGETPEETLTVFNDGDATLLFEAQVLATDAQAWQLPEQTGPIQVAAGGSTTLTVTWAPTEAGEHTATLRLSTNDEDENPLDVPMQGLATGGSTPTQPPTDTPDVSPTDPTPPGTDSPTPPGTDTPGESPTPATTPTQAPITGTPEGTQPPGESPTPEQTSSPTLTPETGSPTVEVTPPPTETPPPTQAPDVDNDGFTAGEDCDDFNPEIYPGADEVCDGADNDCDGDIDDQDGGLVGAPTWYADTDTDGFGDEDQLVSACVTPAGYTDVVGDCDDTDPAINPEADEVCNGQDEDCDGQADEGVLLVFYVDGDNDSYGAGAQVLACEAPGGHAARAGDCDDTNASVFPGAPEQCDSIDNDCDGSIDENITETTFYQDQDQDTYGNPAVQKRACKAPAGYVLNNTDCDDSRASVNPGASEVCNDRDDDCDGQSDEDATDGQSWYPDVDQDEFGSTSGEPIKSCDPIEGYVTVGGDCDDSSATVNPGATEACDAIDNDCDGLTDENVVQQTWYRDQDQDGYGSSTSTRVDCKQPSGYVAVGGDCDDINRNVYPGAPEYCDNVDNDCDGTVDEGASTGRPFYPDADGDGYGEAGSTPVTDCAQPDGYSTNDLDCDDTNPDVAPGQLERCDGIDNDCDGVVDDFSAQEIKTWYTDADEDGFGDPSSPVTDCVQPPGTVTSSSDCNDSDPDVNPAAQEVCNSGIDDDCDGKADDADTGGASGKLAHYRDNDQDGYGQTADSKALCAPSAPYSTTRSGDCNDASASVFPGATEACNGIDEDCDTVVDEGVQTNYYPDQDQDSFGSASASPVQACSAPSGHVLDKTDCNDANPAIHPFAPEQCNGLDDDCDGQTDEGVSNTTYYPDGDGDGFGDSGAPNTVCGSAPSGYVATGGDCDDDAPDTWPGAPERCDGVDTDCDGALDDGYLIRYWADADGDGFGGGSGSCVPLTGMIEVRGDCNDGNAAIKPGATDATGDGVDQDCGGTTGKDPSVGYGANSVATLQAAINAASAGQIIWVNQGTYPEFNLLLNGKAVTLISSHLASRTTIDVARKGRGFLLNKSETASTVIDGFTVKNAALTNGDGAGIYIDAGSPTLKGMVVRDGAATGKNGGGLYVSNSSSVISHTTVVNNSAALGGGVFLVGGTPKLQNVQVLANQSTNQSTGAGLYLNATNAVVENCLIAGNYSIGPVGGVYTAGSTGNWVIRNSVVAYNANYNVYHNSTYSSFEYNNVYSRVGLNVFNLSLGTTNLTVDPGFARYNNNRDFLDDDFHLKPDSGIKDKGSPSISDPDGTRSDIGVYGGAQAEFAWYADSDGDGLPDGWERLFGFDAAQTGTSDADSDGLTNAEELLRTTHPGQADSDGDGATDKAELTQDSDPLDWFKQVGVTGYAEADVPGDFATLQAALDAIQLEGTVRLAAGTWSGGFQLWLKKARVIGASRDGTVLQGNGGAVFLALGTTLDLSAVTLKGGLTTFDYYGGGLTMAGTGGSVTDVLFTGNAARYGAGMIVLRGAPTLTDLTFTSNAASVHGGGLYGLSSASTGTRLDFSSNTATHGAGMFIQGSSMILTDLDFTGNSANYGAGMYISGGGTPKVTTAIFDGNTTTLQGGGAYVSSTGATFTDVLFDGNVATTDGGGLFMTSSNVTLTDVDFVANSSDRTGGALFCNTGNPALTRVGIADNLADLGGGGLYYTGCNGTVKNSLVSGNESLVGGGIYLLNSKPTVTQTTVDGNVASTGGGVYLERSDAALTNLVLSNNVSLHDGGAMAINSANPVVTNVWMESNLAEVGGGAYVYISNPRFVNVAMVDNVVTDEGGGLYLENSQAEVTHCAVVGNTASTGGGLYLFGAGAKPTIRNTIVAHNSAWNLYQTSGAVATVLYSDLYTPSGNNHNLSSVDASVILTDPKLLGAPASDLFNLHLATGSPAINTADPAAAYKDPDGSRSDMGLYGGAGADDFDIDADSKKEWYWTGSYNTPPTGVTASNFDCDDRDPATSACN